MAQDRSVGSLLPVTRPISPFSHTPLIWVGHTSGERAEHEDREHVHGPEKDRTRPGSVIRRLRTKTREPDTIDLERDPAPELPKVIQLPRDEILETLRDVQDFSFRRALWGVRSRDRFGEAVSRFRNR